MTDDQYYVPAVLAASRILAALAQPDADGLRQSELARTADLSRSTAHNMLHTLEHLGYVQRDHTTRLYRLGAALVPLGQAAAQTTRVAEVAGERIPTLAAEVGLSFALAQVTSLDEAVIIDRAYAPSGLHVGITLGDRYGPFDGAIGKCMLAALGAEDADQQIKQADLAQRTEATITRPKELAREVRLVRGRGWASSVKEFNENHAVAAGIWGQGGRMELILLALGFPAQLGPKQISSVGSLLRETANAITEACGGEPIDRVRHAPLTTGPSGAKGSKTA